MRWCVSIDPAIEKIGSRAVACNIQCRSAGCRPQAVLPEVVVVLTGPHRIGHLMTLLRFAPVHGVFDLNHSRL